MVETDCSETYPSSIQMKVIQNGLSLPKPIALADPGGALRRPPPPPNRINFFHFHIRFCRKVYTSEVGAPQWIGAPPPPPPTGNPGSATELVLFLNDNELGSKPIFFSSSVCVCHPQSEVRPSNYLIPFQFHSMSIQSLSSVLKIEAPRMHHIILVAGIISLPRILVSIGHKGISFIMQSSVVELHYFIPSLNIHTDVSHSTFKALLILLCCIPYLKYTELKIHLTFTYVFTYTFLYQHEPVSLYVIQYYKKKIIYQSYQMIQ